MEPSSQAEGENCSSHHARSRAGTTTSNSQFNLQQYLDSPRSQTLSSPALSARDNAVTYLSPLPQDPSNYLPTPVSRTYSPFPTLSPELLDADWSGQQEGTPASTPSIKVEEQGARYSTSPQPAALSGCAVTAAMSTVAIPFDPTYAMGTRSAFTWPGIGGPTSESSGHLLGHDLSSLGTGSDASLTPPSVSRSVTASPPRSSMTPEQRELKRQMDQVRRDTKTHSRIRRSNSNPYMPDTSSALNMPVYTTAPAPISLLAEPATAMNNQPYIPSYSPPPSTVSSMPSVYQTSYQHQHQHHPQPLQPSYNMGLDYSSAFQPSSSYGRGRPGPMSVGSEPNMMYHVPAVMTTGGAGVGPESGHVRVVQSRPKPQCWEHGCNGRQFSTFSNLLRHQREKSGQAAKATCPICGAEFTRTTARNGHLLHDKCKQKRNSTSSN